MPAASFSLISTIFIFKQSKFLLFHAFPSEFDLLLEVRSKNGDIMVEKALGN